MYLQIRKTPTVWDRKWDITVFLEFSFTIWYKKSNETFNQKIFFSLARPKLDVQAVLCYHHHQCYLLRGLTNKIKNQLFTKSQLGQNS